MYVKKTFITLLTFSSIGFCWWLPVQQSSAEVERARIENDLAFRVKQSGISQPNQMESGAASDQSGAGNADTGQQRQQGTPSQNRPVNKGSGNTKPITKSVSNTNFDIDRLAYAVAMAETKNGTLGYGKTHNNAFGIKKGNTVPCQTVGARKMCKFDSIEDSYAAFKKIWSKWYGGFPTKRSAAIWTGNDNPDSWLRIVTHYYYQ